MFQRTVSYIQIRCIRSACKKPHQSSLVAKLAPQHEPAFKGMAWDDEIPYERNRQKLHQTETENDEASFVGGSSQPHQKRHSTQKKYEKFSNRRNETSFPEMGDVKSSGPSSSRNYAGLSEGYDDAEHNRSTDRRHPKDRRQTTSKRPQSSEHNEVELLPTITDFSNKKNFPKSSFLSKFHKEELLNFGCLMEFAIKHAEQGPLSVENQFSRLTDTVLPLWSIPYKKQLHLKYRHLTRILQRLQMRFSNRSNSGGPYTPKKYRMPCELSPMRFAGQHRNRSEFSINVGIDGDPKTVGFYIGKPVNSDIICVPPDHLINLKDSHKAVAKHFQNFIRSSSYDTCLSYETGGVWKNVLVRSTEDGQLMVIAIINPRELEPRQIEEIKEDFKEYFITGPGEVCNVTSLLFQTSLKTKSSDRDSAFEFLHGKPHLTETVNGQRFVIKPDSFFQTNSSAAALLFNAIKDLVGMHSHATILDGCCGTGAIGIQLAPHVQAVIGVDPAPSAIEDANTNAELNNLTNCTFFEDTLDKILPKLTADFADVSEVIAILNPPKNGLSPHVINQIRMCPTIRKIVYVCCRPAFTFGNLELICQKLAPKNTKLKMPPRFRPTYAIPIDMFPHTIQSELVILFERENSSFIS